jgi:hypothetical protein
VRPLRHCDLKCEQLALLADSLTAGRPKELLLVSKPAYPADEVPQWLLGLGVCLLAAGALLNLWLAKQVMALVLAVAAVALPALAIYLRRNAGRGAAPRIRRVVVNDKVNNFTTVPLETAKYLTPVPKPGLPDLPVGAIGKV